MTLQQLADEIGTSTQVLSRYERCEREADYNTLVKIAQFFNVSIDYLLGFKAAISPTPATLKNDEKELLSIFNALESVYQGQILEYARYFAERRGIKKKNI